MWVCVSPAPRVRLTSSHSPALALDVNVAKRGLGQKTAGWYLTKHRSVLTVTYWQVGVKVIHEGNHEVEITHSYTKREQTAR
ncbi:hypothetical protein RRG08_058912 [Elysia crispata]|uniref:Uncharacterized protein n=1 Tax=Elysia crispata TaxID=231223 RepID=A0AAE1DDZ6_9GAST|nr:hypothetical protein RRG08_058912 [Elysia crispata]